MTKEYPFEGKTTDINGFEMHYLDEGRGEPVVMLHGNPSWSFYYRKLVRTLSPDYRCIVPDHIGMGLSEKPAAKQYPYTLQRRVEDLTQLIDQLNLGDKITLVLHDWGGMIGMAWAHLNPGRVRRLIISNTAAFHLPSGKKMPLALKVCRLPVLGDLLVRGFNAFALMAARVGCKRNPLSPELRRHYCAPYNSWKNRLATLKFVQDIPLVPGDQGYDLIGQVEQGLDRYRNIPALIFWGEKDFVFDWHFRNRWERYLPNARVYLYRDGGHYILEDAADDVLPKIHAFLKQNPLEG